MRSEGRLLLVKAEKRKERRIKGGNESPLQKPLLHPPGGQRSLWRIQTSFPWDGNLPAWRNICICFHPTFPAGPQGVFSRAGRRRLWQKARLPLGTRPTASPGGGPKHAPIPPRHEQRGSLGGRRYLSAGGGRGRWCAGTGAPSWGRGKALRRRPGSPWPAARRRPRCPHGSRRPASQERAAASRGAPRPSTPKEEPQRKADADR